MAGKKGWTEGKGYCDRVTTKELGSRSTGWPAVAGLAEPPVQCSAERPVPSRPVRPLPARRERQAPLHHSWSPTRARSDTMHAFADTLAQVQASASLSELLVLDTRENGKSDDDLGLTLLVTPAEEETRQTRPANANNLLTTTTTTTAQTSGRARSRTGVRCRLAVRCKHRCRY